MKIKLTSVMVDDQDKALKFYTESLGFIKKVDIPLGDARWLTVVSADEEEGTELVLEPDGNPVLEGVAIEFKKALFKNGIPFTAFEVDNIHKEHKRLRLAGVEFVQEPTNMGMVTQAVFDDTCGNLIQIYEISVVA